MTTYLLHNIGVSPDGDPRIASNYNTKEEIEALPKDALLTFDGVYKNVWENRDLLEGRNVILFVMGDYVGGNNYFDMGMPYEDYCDFEHILELADNYGCKIGWHTWTHKDLTTLSREEIMKEVTPIFPMKYFAYPYGKYNDLVVECVKEAGYEEAWSVTQGNTDQFTKKRIYL